MKRKAQRKIAVLMTALLFVVLVLPVFAADVYVKAGAKGKGTSPKDPYGELWKAVAKANRGDVIHVAAGTYNGKGGSGHFVVTVPYLTLAGGYNADFSSRDPFKNLTILERSKKYKGDWTGLPEGIIAGGEKEDHQGLIVDGLVLNCETRNHYKNDVVAMKAPTYPGKAFQARSPNIKIRNCIIMNPVGEGVYISWQGTENEISNCLIINTMYAALECRSSQPGSVVTIKNNTIAFGWFYPTKGGSFGVFVGSQGQLILENNIIAFMQTEGEEAGIGVINGFGNEDLVMKNNLFFACNGAFYKYMDSNKQNLVVYTNDGLDELNDEDFAEDFMLSESGDNREGDPGIKPDTAFATKFANFVGSEPGKLNMDAMNQWRQSMGLPLQADKGSARKNFGFAYPVKAVIPNLISTVDGVGAKADVNFEEYTSAGEAEKPADYEEVEVTDFKKGGKYEKGNDGRAVIFKAGMGDKKTVYELPNAGKNDYLCFMLLKPGEDTYTRENIYGYILKGSEAEDAWNKLFKKRDNYNKKGGVVIKGLAYDFPNRNYPYPVGVVITEVEKP
ncbi:MAG: right-handed parallel beta-helix repeat-containing protein [Spirochaetales bacterium]|nr:right-handed parallel beta-helix repeat-containing protein [Spirochaetales bacterium]